LPKNRNFIIISIIFLCSSLFGLSWAISSPPGSASDETYHLASTWCAWGENEICKFDGEALDNGRRNVTLTSDFSKVGCFRSDLDKVNKSAACYFQDKENENRTAWEMNSGNYPGLTYSVLRIFATNNVEESVILMRIFNYSIFTLLLILAYMSLSSKIYFASILSFFVTLIPVSIFFLTSINPSSWTIIGVGFYWAYLWNFLDDRKILEQKKIAVGLILCSILSIGSRSDASIYILLINALFLISLIFEKKMVRQLTKKIIVVLFISLFSFIQFTYNKQFEAESTGGESVPGVNLLFQNFTELPKYYLGIFGGRGPDVWPFGLGWFDTQIPVLVPALGVVTIIFVIMFTFNKMSIRQRVIVSALPIFMVLIPLLVLQLRQSNATYFLQPRYLIPMLVVFLGVLTIEIKSIKDRKIIIYFILLSLTIGNSISLFTNLKRYTVGLDSEVSFFSKIDWWWSIPFSPGLTWAVGTISFPILIYFALSRDTKSNNLIKN
jgi:hypothetical protein